MLYMLLDNIPGVVGFIGKGGFLGRRQQKTRQEQRQDEGRKKMTWNLYEPMASLGQPIDLYGLRYPAFPCTYAHGLGTLTQNVCVVCIKNKSVY